MASPLIPPLRYQKGNHGASPNKVVATGRPLSELSPMSLRRNSPSFPQAKGGLLKNETSSPAGSSPFSNILNSPRQFWHGRDPASPSRENKDPNDSTLSSSPTKRSSIENLKKASRVKNSTMFAKEQQSNYDPARPTILDGRPLSTCSGNVFTGRGSDGLRSSDSFAPPTITAELDKVPASPTTMAQLSPSKLNISPTKSSLSKRTGANMRYGGFDPETGIWEDEDDEEKKLPEGRVLHRHAKSVTFDQAPPQINEYEMTTPDPSSVASGSREGSYESMDDDGDEEYSFDRESSMDHDDSFDASLEDTDKTPVVLPEDWRFMSPDVANINLAQHEEDVFDDNVGSPEPGALPGRTNYRPHQTSVNSIDSNGQPRPLPPLPPSMSNVDMSPGSRDSLSGAIERMSSGQRALPFPPPAASISKSDLRRISGGSLSVEDRLRLMLIKDQDQQKRQVEDEPEHRLRRTKSRDLSFARDESPQAENNTPSEVDSKVAVDSQHDPAPRISRDSILQQLRSANSQDEINGLQEHASQTSSVVYDPDFPIPSLEDPTQHIEYDVEVKEEDSDTFSLSSIPSYYGQATDDGYDNGEDAVSDYSQASVVFQPTQQNLEQGHETPRAHSPANKPVTKQLFSERISLPEFTHFGGQSSFDLGLNEYMTPPIAPDTEKPLPPAPTESIDLPDLAALRDSIQRPYTPEEPLEPPKLSFSGDESSADPGTPNSVIRHPVSISPEPEVAETDSIGEDSKFTTRNLHSNSRTVSAESALSEREESALSEREEPTQKLSLLEPIDLATSSGKRVSSLVRLELTTETSDDGFGLGFGLEKEFDRVVEVQKRGYLMRQNTKIVVASERAVQDEQQTPIIPEEQNTPGLPQQPNEVHASVRKASQPTWVAEPWNGKSRRKSIKLGGEKAIAKRKPVEGAVPPLPGMPSNVNESLAPMAEDELGEEEAEEFEDGVERGRLFVKVVGVKDLQLPFSHHERTQFALTLDNGLHCVTTAWLDLAKDAPIGQEFELVVLNELEFQLTLQMKLEEPKIERPASPTKPPASPKKQGTFSKLFGSPKKKKDSDIRTSDLQLKRPITPPSAYELVQGLVAKDGSFARAYVSLNEHEKYSYGRPYSVDIKCFNEWAMEHVSVGSSRSKKSVVELQRRPPYEIGKLELQLLYVPKPKGAKDEDMPKSMNSAIRAIRDAEEKSKQQATIKSFEGYLSQQGGDCPYWRRRFFKLIGTKLTAYHETTLQPRATINLVKAIKLIDDKSSLTQRETSTKGGGRRKSGFAEEGYMFVDEGFRIRFANGEMIDFYADSTAAKDEWMVALSQVVGKGIPNSSATQPKGWTEMVLKRERCLDKKAKADAHARKARLDEQVRSAGVSSPTGIPIPISKAMPPLPRPTGHVRSESYQSVDTASRSTANSPVKTKMTSEERRQKARSMAF